MVTSLRSKLDELASAFASGILAAIRTASIEDLVGQASSSRPSAAAPRPAPRKVPRPAPASVRAAAPTAKPAKAVKAVKAVKSTKERAGRLERRSPADIAHVLDLISSLLRANPKGLRAEEIRQKLGLRPNEMPRPLKDGLASGRLTKSGQKRATTYVVRMAGAPASKPAAAAPKAKKASKAPKASKTRKSAKAVKAPAPAAKPAPPTDTTPATLTTAGTTAAPAGKVVKAVGKAKAKKTTSKSKKK